MYEIVKHNLTVEQLRKKVHLYAQLMDISILDVEVSVRGTFRDKQGELMFVRQSTPVDVSLIGRKCLTLMVDGGWVTGAPVDGNIASAFLSIG